jgi:hypothetical protein
MSNNYKYNEQPNRHVQRYLDPNPTAERSRLTLALTQRGEKIPPIVNVPEGTRAKSNASRNKKSKGVIDILIAREEREQRRNNTAPGTPLFHPENFIINNKKEGKN